MGTFEKLRSHVDVTSGRLTLRMLDEPNRWVAFILELGLRYNMFVTGDMSHWCNQEANGTTQ